MTEYTAGFLFDYDKKNVVLLLKNRPDRQKGLYNAIGGKIDGKETPFQCITRESIEEIGIYTHWNHFLTLAGYELGGEEWKMDMFWGVFELSEVTKMEDQEPKIFPIDKLPDNIMPNCRWMIPMALSIEEEYLDYFDVHECLKF